jgi:hypothetical protein
MPREVADWRYLDSDFNRGRNRGFAWLRHQRMEGMIGLIPFQVCDAGTASGQDANWCCDWMVVDPASSPGMGMILLRRAIESSMNLFALGANEIARRLLPRVATHTIADAGVTMHLPLRSGAILRRLERRGMLGNLRVPRILSMIPLRHVARSGRSPEVRTERGLSTQIGPLLHSRPGAGWHPCYDFRYLDWQLGRSPLARCWTTYSPPMGEARAAAVYWRPVASSESWRIAIWCKNREDHVEWVLREAVAEIYRLGGMAVSTLVSRLDVEAQATLRSAGFLASKRRRPLYVCAGKPDGAISELQGLTYLDNDLSYIGTSHEGWGYASQS